MYVYRIEHFNTEDLKNFLEYIFCINTTYHNRDINFVLVNNSKPIQIYLILEHKKEL